MYPMSEVNQNERDRYPLNAAGPFYVEKDMCLCCMMPEYEAPELMGFDGETNHCYFERQPNTPEEIEHAINAVASSDIAALRYAGSDPYILRRLVEAQSKSCCDVLTPKGEGGESWDGGEDAGRSGLATLIEGIMRMLRLRG